MLRFILIWFLATLGLILVTAGLTLFYILYPVLCLILVALVCGGLVAWMITYR